MRRFLTSFVLASLLVTTLPASYAQRAAHKTTKKAAAPVVITKRGVDTIAADQLRDYLTFIASDEMEGRDTPSRGLNTTAKFLAMNLTRWGFKPRATKAASSNASISDANALTRVKQRLISAGEHSRRERIFFRGAAPAMSAVNWSSRGMVGL
jgi:hypothetical protein